MDYFCEKPPKARSGRLNVATSHEMKRGRAVMRAVETATSLRWVRGHAQLDGLTKFNERKMLLQGWSTTRPSPLGVRSTSGTGASARGQSRHVQSLSRGQAQANRRTARIERKIVLRRCRARVAHFHLLLVSVCFHVQQNQENEPACPQPGVFLNVPLPTKIRSAFFCWAQRNMTSSRRFWMERDSSH